MKFPIINHTTDHFPSKPKCPVCGFKVFEPNQFVLLSGGAMRLDKSRQNSLPSTDLYGFLDLTFHGAHENGKARNEMMRDEYLMTTLVKDSKEGQFEMYFCSTECLRAFLNKCIDELEVKVAKSELHVAKALEASKQHGA